MKNLLKYLIIIDFVMMIVFVPKRAFAVYTSEIGTANLNNTAQNSVKVGDVLEHPEIGWQRYDDSNSGIVYSSDFQTYLSPWSSYYESCYGISQRPSA